MKWGGVGDEGNEELSFNGVSVLHDAKVLEIGCTAIWIYVTLLNYTLKMIKMVFLLCVF